MRKLLYLFLCGCLAAVAPAHLHAQQKSASVDEDTYELAAVEVLPRLQNMPAVARALQALYPPELRDVGVSGQVVLRFKVKSSGAVDETSIKVVSTSHAGFDVAAQQVISLMQFTPARVAGKPVTVWVEQPLMFVVAGE